MAKSIHSEEQRRLSQFLKATRRAAGMTQTQVAGAMGRPQSFVAKYEGGERRLDLIELVAVAHALGREPLQLLRGALRAIERGP
ncbi:MAG: helix-turn-helix domain-containing protein [Parvibaculaceae bacterium]